ncbi:MAG: sodium:proton antiporter [Thermodesulfobacteriota bacterium]|nr:sodium:proton antiporter [Thermodesulfobacteriota bacterium]
MHTIAILITLAALFTYINHRFVRIPMSIGLMLLSLAISLCLMFLDSFGLPVADYAHAFVTGIDFNKVLMQGMLGLLLFAGALHVNLNDLAAQKIEIAIFATLGVITSTLVVGYAVYGLSSVMDLGLRLIDCLLFGALISPTDPIAVLSIMKKAGAPKSLELKIAGESLFNDGIGVVVFLILLEIAVGEGHLTPGHVVPLFAKEVIGGVLFGLCAGYVVYRMLKTINNYQVEVMLTLAMVIGGYSLAHRLHISAPMAMVVAGLMIGNHGRSFAMSADTCEHLDMFWELIDEVLNAILFVLIGLEVLVLTLKAQYLLAGIVAIPVVLFARLISIGGPVMVLKRWRTYAPGAVQVMTWGGLRGGISVALALSLPKQCNRELLLTMSYAVVVFAIVVQGLTIKYLIQDDK